MYEKDEEFVAFKNLVGNTKHLALTRFAYLMPAKQRSMARFMNMYPIVDWAKKILDNYHRMTADERYFYSFVPRNASFVEELDEVMTTYADIMKICKKEGFSAANVTRCKPSHNISSDIIESDFGIFKDSMPTNKTNGFTESILYIPLRPKMCSLENVERLDIKAVMERRTVEEVKMWKLTTLRPNPLVKRRNLLVG